MKSKVVVKNNCFSIYFVLHFVLLLVIHCHALSHVTGDRYNTSDSFQGVSDEKTAANPFTTGNKFSQDSNVGGIVQRDSDGSPQEKQLQDGLEILKPSDDKDLPNSLKDANDAWGSHKALSSHVSPNLAGWQNDKSPDQISKIIKVIHEDISADMSTDLKAPEEDFSSDGPSVDNMEASAKDNTSSAWAKKSTSEEYESLNDLKRFNYSDAIIRGELFQLEVCSPMSCAGPVDDAVIHTSPTCAKCYCDEVCITYRDCCNVSEEMKHKYESTEPLKTECFEYFSGKTVVIISSCPKATASQIAVDLSEDKNSTNMQAHLSKCQKCGRSNKRKSLVTSKISGITYCNKHCLICNEPRTKSHSRLVWPKIKTCYTEDSAGFIPSSVPEVFERNSSSKNNTKMTKVCTVYFLQPSSFNTELTSVFHECSLDTQMEEVNDCGDNSMEMVDNETFAELKALCGSYNWPVYSMNSTFRNIFCFLCHGYKPLMSVYVSTVHVLSVSSVGLPNLAMMTDLSGRFSIGDVNLERLAYENSGKSVSQSDEGSFKNRSGTFYTVDHTCDSGFWFNFLTGECLPVQCSKGRNLTRPSSSSESNQPLADVQSCLSAIDEADVDDIGEFYILNVLWYLVGNDLDFGKSEEDENGEDLEDHDAVYPTDDDPSSGDIDDSQQKAFMCVAYDMQDYEEVSIPSHDVYFEDNQVLLAPSLVTEVSSDYQTIPNDNVDDEMFKNESEVNGVLDYFLMNETGRLLRQANVSSLLMKMKLNAKDNQTNTTINMRFLETREIVVYFQKTSLGGHSDFERKIVDLFSAKTETSKSGKTFEFRSVLVQKHNVDLNNTQKVRYFSHHEGYTNDTVCCDEINFEEFHSKLSKMACTQVLLKPINIHLVSTCPHVILNTTDFKITTKQTLIHSSTGITLKRHQYLRSRSSILVCTSVMDALRPNVAFSTSTDYLMFWESLLTLVFLPISMLCLLITFVTYCVFPVLRSMPGKNNMFLVFWLFWAQTLTIVSPLTPRYSTACVIMGILLHFSWLATLAWTCVCSFHMFNVFVIQKGTPNDSRSHRWYITCYSLLSHLFPVLVIVCVCVTSRQLTSTGSLGYGEVVCYLNSTILIALAFVLPLAVILVANMAFFFCTVMSIARIEKIKRQTGIAEKRNPYIYAKLSSLTSITWVLALLAEIPGCHFLRLGSVALNSCQGVFLFVSYIINRRVRRLWGSIRKTKRSRASNLATNTYTNASGTSTKPLTLSTPNLTAL